ncbi:MAG: hypothetical protein MZU84_00735 [Sphingobacterium sp.]|nr:hypothetical protein [Sphingobacterium sp.]
MPIPILDEGCSQSHGDKRRAALRAADRLLHPISQSESRSSTSHTPSCALDASISSARRFERHPYPVISRLGRSLRPSPNASRAESSCSPNRWRQLPADKSVGTLEVRSKEEAV